MLVELDIFSGRPNPRWQLDGRRARQLERIHRGLTASSERPPEPPGLGYRGFRYRLGETDWRAWRGQVSSDDRVLADPARTVERLLVDALPAEYAGLRPLVAAEIGGAAR